MTDLDINTVRSVLNSIRATAAAVAADADSYATSPIGPEQLADAITTVEAADQRIRYLLVLLEAQLSPHRPMDDSELWHVVPLMVAAFSGRLSQDSREEIDAAWCARNFSQAAWMLVTTIRANDVVLEPGEDRLLHRVERFLADFDAPLNVID